MVNKTVFIVDDHLLIREMWREIFFNTENIEVIGESGSVKEAVEMIRQKRPSVVLLDINLSDGSGFDAVPLIRKFSPGTRIIAVSMHCQPAYAKKMLQMGASAYVTKNSSRKEILLAVDEVIQDRKYLCEEIRNLITGQMMNDEGTPSSRLKDLSMREIEIIRLIKDGHSSKEIAARLGIAVRTVEVHRHNILKKLDLKNTAALISFINKTDIMG